MWASLWAQHSSQAGTSETCVSCALPPKPLMTLKPRTGKGWPPYPRQRFYVPRVCQYRRPGPPHCPGANVVGVPGDTDRRSRSDVLRQYLSCQQPRPKAPAGDVEILCPAHPAARPQANSSQGDAVQEQDDDGGCVHHERGIDARSRERWIAKTLAHGGSPQGDAGGTVKFTPNRRETRDPRYRLALRTVASQREEPGAVKRPYCCPGSIRDQRGKAACRILFMP